MTNYDYLDGLDKVTVMKMKQNDILAVKFELRRCIYMINDTTIPTIKTYKWIWAVLESITRSELDGDYQHIKMFNFIMNTLSDINVATVKTDNKIKDMIANLIGSIK